MKTPKKASIVLHEKRTQHTRAERTILEDVQHPFIVKLFYAFQTRRKLYLVLEYVPGGELFMHMARERMFSEDLACFVAAEIVLALEHLHLLGIIYRDLKPENVLVDQHGHVILTDFGLSKVSLDEDGKTNTICGTVEYMAPEVVQDKIRYDKTVDWWALGIMIYDMIVGCAPFRGRNRKLTMDAIVNHRLKCPPFMSPDAKDLVTKLLRKHAGSRLGSGENGAAKIKAHPFFRKLDWEQLKRRNITPPFVPVLTAEDDVSNFDDQFTTQYPELETPLASPLSPSMDHLFKGFSYVNKYII